MSPKGTAVVGQGCKVTGGANKGKTGTYSKDDEGSLWCEGSWGGTECGSGKCENKAAEVQIFEFPDFNGVIVQEVEGIIDVKGKGIFQFSTILDAVAGTSRKINTLQLATTSLADLSSSKSETERLVAKILAAHFETEE